MGMDLFLFPIMASMRANLRMEENTVKEYKFLQMEIGMRASLKMICLMAEVSINGVMKEFMKDN